MKAWERSLTKKKNKTGLSASQVTQRLALELAEFEARHEEKRQDKFRREFDALLRDCQISRADARRVLAALPA